jgi:UPF0042 nucleotide-binding protein
MSDAILQEVGRPARIVIISGMSGSGKSTAIRALEDIGFFCIDNLPVVLLPKLIELFPRQPDEIEQIALVVDARESRFLASFTETLDRVRSEGGRVEVIFLDCTDQVLQRRYSETRRRHPLAPEDSIEAGIGKERTLLEALRREADRIIDTSGLNPHQLRQIVQEHFSTVQQGFEMTLALMSFGFKHGIPPLCDLVFDVRFLPNPYFVPELREQAGQDRAVADFVLADPNTNLLIERVLDFLETFRPLYDREGKSYLTVGIGCTGGRHRSVAVVEELGHRLRRGGVPVVVRHRDMDRT